MEFFKFVRAFFEFLPRLLMGAGILVMSLLLSSIAWKMGLLPDVFPEVKVSKEDPVITIQKTGRDCLRAEMYEAGKDKVDMILIAHAVSKLSTKYGGVCNVFTQYRLLRAPSQGAYKHGLLHWGRDVGLVLAKASTRKHLKYRKAVVDAILKHHDAGEDLMQDLPEPARRLLKCEMRVNRVWPTNSAGTDVQALKAWADTVWKSDSSQTTFYARCPK